MKRRRTQSTAWTPRMNVVPRKDISEPAPASVRGLWIVPGAISATIGGLIGVSAYLGGMAMNGAALLACVSALCVFAPLSIGGVLNNTRQSTEYAEMREPEPVVEAPLREPLMLRQWTANGIVEKPLFDEPQAPAELAWQPTWKDVLRFVYDARRYGTAWNKLHKLPSGQILWVRPKWDVLVPLLIERGWARWRNSEHHLAGWELTFDDRCEDEMKERIERGDKEPWLK